jgi:predicted site-specific integrase-resolvase
LRKGNPATSGGRRFVTATRFLECPERLARFGYAYLERHLKTCGVEIEVTSEKEPEDARAELVQDLLAVVTSFSARLYGARGGRRIRRGFRELIRHVEAEGQKG